MEDCIFGINYEEESLKIKTIGDNQQMDYDFICKVTLTNAYNGNGTYSISINSTQLGQRFMIRKWRIKKAWIGYNWISSSAQFIMIDPDGNETNTIIASTSKGSTHQYGFDVESLARSIFTKAQTIAEEYPSAAICNVMMGVEDLWRMSSWIYIKERYQEVCSDPNEYVEFVEYAISEVKKYVAKYNEAKTVLEDSEDPMAEVLLKKLDAKSKKFLYSLKYD